MKVLFVCSGNSDFFEISPFIKSQADSLIDQGIDLEVFPIKGKGLKGYLGNIPKLSDYLRKNEFDLIHAHFIHSAWTARMSTLRIPIIISVMGSDAYGDVNRIGRIKPSSLKEIFLTQLIQAFVKGIIVKSDKLYKYYIWRKRKTRILPNGVNLRNIIITDKIQARKNLKLEENKKYILFLGEKNNCRKNYPLFLNAINLLNGFEFDILTPYPIAHSDISLYLSASDVLVLTSTLEGSPNVIKEAMACNCPIVSTDVGDVKWVLGDTKGCFVTSFEPDDIANNIMKALDFTDRTNGRERIIELGLDSNATAKKIIDFYNVVLSGKF